MRIKHQKFKYFQTLTTHHLLYWLNYLLIFYILIHSLLSARNSS